MGHRTYLYIEKEGQNEELFENNNGMALFWLSLIALDNFEIVKRNWFKLEKLEQNNYDGIAPEEIATKVGELDFHISFAQLDRKASAFREYLRYQGDQSIIKLYEDFIKHIQEKGGPKGKVHIDLLALSNFSGLDIFVKELQDILNAISNRDFQFLDQQLFEDIASLTGWSVNNNESFSPVYDQIYKDQKGRVFPKRKKLERSDKKYFVLFLFGSIGFLAGALFSFVDQSWILGIISLLIALVLMLFTYVFGDNLYTDFKSRKKKQIHGD